MNDKLRSQSPLADPVERATQSEIHVPDPGLPTRPRKPFGSAESRMAWPPIPGYRIRWFNDTPGRVERAKEAGYEHVKDRAGAAVKLIVGVHEGGAGMDGYLMMIPEAWYDEDFARKQEAVDMIDLAIMRGKVKDARPDDNLYVPRDGVGESAIKFGVSRGRLPT